MRITLQPNARFHDGSPADARTIATALRSALPKFMGTMFEDVDSVNPGDDNEEIEISFKRRSPFLIESLEAPIKKPGSPSVGTGPFFPAGSESPNELVANKDYYLGPPTISRIVVTSYPSVRSAWAELLRNNIDMLYEVGPDEWSSIQDATTVSTFTFVSPYQYVVLLNQKSSALQSPDVRRALNEAIDPAAIVRDAFNGHAKESDGLVWPQNWALGTNAPRRTFAPAAAAALLKSRHVHFKCLVPTDYEQIALVVQRQLASVGATMSVEAVAPDQVSAALQSSTFEAILFDIVGGPSLLRPYLLWHTHGTIHPDVAGSPALDAALDRVRNAATDDEYRAAVANLQKVTLDDPPAIYLAWGQRARAVSNRFAVPAGDPGRDVLATLRLWKPSTGAQSASRN